MEERLLIDVKALVMRVVCKKCGGASSAPVASWRLVGACPSCAIRFEGDIFRLADLAHSLKDFGSQQDKEGQSFLLEFEVPLVERRPAAS